MAERLYKVGDRVAFDHEIASIENYHALVCKRGDRATIIGEPSTGDALTGFYVRVRMDSGSEFNASVSWLRPISVVDQLGELAP